MTGHVVVIGAGVYGAAVAASLARRGAAVTVVDAGAAAGGTSGATFSWTNSGGKQPRAYHDLNVAGMEAHRKLAAEVPGADWYHEGGNLEWAADGAGRERLRAKVAGLRDYGYDARWLRRGDALRLEPELDAAALPDDGIAWFPREGWIEPVRLVAHLLAGCGATVVTDDPVVAIDVGDAAVRAVVLGSGRRIAAGAVVDCAGPRAAEIAALAGLTLPLRNTRGALVCTSPVAVSVARVVHAPRVNLRPDGGGRLLLHSRGLDSDDLDGAARLSDSAVDDVLDAARALYPGGAAAPGARGGGGARPPPGAGVWVQGRAPQLPTFHFAVSHSGATLCVHAGDLVAAEVLGEPQDEALAPFRVERFA